MGRRRRGASNITLPKLGPQGDLARPETARVNNLLARDAADREAQARRQKHGYCEKPANLRHYETIDQDKPAERRRYRALPGDHPLVKAWAKGKILQEEFYAGNLYRIIYERANDPTGKDSSLGLVIDGGKRPDAASQTMADIQDCRDSLTDIASCMGKVDANIVRKLCGEGLSMSAAVQGSVPCVPAAVLGRACEALRALVGAIQGARLPDIAPEVLKPRS